MGQAVQFDVNPGAGAPPAYARSGAAARRQASAGDSVGSIISGSIIGGFVQVVHRSHGDAASLLAKNHLSVKDCGSGDRAISFNDYAALLEMAATYIDCPNFGMTLAEHQDCLSLMVNVERALNNAKTIGEFFRYGAKFMYTHTSGVQMRLESYPESRQTALRIEVIADGVPYRRQVVEHLHALAHDCVVALSGGRIRAREVWFAHAPVAAPATYERRLRTKVRFAEPFNGLLFHTDDLDFPIIARDENVLRSELQAISERFPHRPKIAFQVKSIIHRELDQSDCSRETVAGLLRINPRTLHRRLQDEGTTFEAIREQVRRDMLVHYLAQSSIGIIEVAARLGYAEPAVLTRACRRWFGVSPKVLRQSLTSREPGALDHDMIRSIHDRR